MRERPILFTGPMVRAILAGKKTQTRRPVKPQPTSETVTWGCVGGQGFGFLFGDDFVRCPYGVPGDRLWVRETWAPCGDPRDSDRLSFHVRYRADEVAALGAYGATKWKPAIHMPRKLSRLLLDVTAVRVARLHSLTNAEAAAEGVGTMDAFMEKWDALYVGGPFSVRKNPWVWVVEFRRVEAARSAA